MNLEELHYHADMPEEHVEEFTKLRSQMASIGKAWGGVKDIATFKEFRNSPEGFWNHTEAFAKSTVSFVALLVMAVLTAKLVGLALAGATFAVYAGAAIAAILAVLSLSATTVMSGVNHFFGNDTETKTAVEQVESDAPATSNSQHSPSD